MGKREGEFREPNRKDKITRFRSVTYVRLLGLLVNTLGSHLKYLSDSVKHHFIILPIFYFVLSFSSFGQEGDVKTFCIMWWG